MKENRDRPVTYRIHPVKAGAESYVLVMERLQRKRKVQP